MRRSITTPATHTLLALVTTLMALTSGTGCVGTGQHVSNWYYGLAAKAQTKHELADIRHDTRLALAEQEQEALRLAAARDVEAARLDAERRRLEIEFCQANQEALQRRVKQGLRETVESKVAFHVEQGLEVGELEVDVEALQRILQEREREAQRRPPPQPPIQKAPCSCCDQPCGCQPGLLRRFCPHCRHKPCQAERDCGGPEALARLEQEALQRPLRPTEIPMKLPVRLSFGFEQPEMEAARIRRVPPPGQEPLQRPCDCCPKGGYDPLPCTHPAGPPAGPVQGHYHPQPSAAPAYPVVEPQVGPQPVPEAEARRPEPPASGFGLKAFPFALGRWAP